MYECSVFVNGEPFVLLSGTMKECVEFARIVTGGQRVVNECGFTTDSGREGQMWSVDGDVCASVVSLS